MHMQIKPDEYCGHEVAVAAAATLVCGQGAHHQVNSLLVASHGYLTGHLILGSIELDDVELGAPTVARVCNLHRALQQQ